MLAGKIRSLVAMPLKGDIFERIPLGSKFDLAKLLLMCLWINVLG